MSRHEKLHGLATLGWVAMVPVSIATGWIGSVVFIAAISIYANAAAHWSGYEAARAERKQGEQ